MTQGLSAASTRWRAFVPLAAAVVAIGLAAARALLVDHVIGGYTGCHGCFVLPALGHDAALLAGVFALLALACGARAAWLRSISGAMAGLAIVAMALDVGLIALLTRRLYLGEFLRFAGEGSADWSVLRPVMDSALGWLFVPGALLVLAVAVLAAVPAWRSTGAARGLAAATVLAALAAIPVRLHDMHYVHAEFVRNLVEINLPRGADRQLTPAHLAAQRARLAATPRTCTARAGTRPNVVLVLVESLSAYQSRLLGGPLDWTPKLDATARANHYLTHFYANGSNTEGGLMAALAGRPPILAPGRTPNSMGGSAGGDGTLPAFAHAVGYAADFFSTFDLSFLGTGQWLRDLGFDAVEGDRQPFYRGKRRYQFDSVADGVLFDRFLDWLDHRTDERPFVAVLLTLSSHPPFVDPRSGRIDPAGSFGYVDAELARLHDALAARGFLDHGVLLVTGDHRAMTPLSPAEYRQWNERAFARIPLVIAGAVDMPARVDAAFQQSDLPASIGALIGARACTSPFTGSLLQSGPVAPEYVLHARGDDPSRVDVYYGAGEVARYLEDGDDSRFIGAPPPQAGLVSAWIDVLRGDAGAAISAPVPATVPASR